MGGPDRRRKHLFGLRSRIVVVLRIGRRAGGFCRGRGRKPHGCGFVFRRMDYVCIQRRGGRGIRCWVGPPFHRAERRRVACGGGEFGRRRRHARLRERIDSTRRRRIRHHGRRRGRGGIRLRFRRTECEQRRSGGGQRFGGGIGCVGLGGQQCCQRGGIRFHGGRAQRRICFRRGRERGPGRRRQPFRHLRDFFLRSRGGQPA